MWKLSNTTYAGITCESKLLCVEYSAPYTKTNAFVDHIYRNKQVKGFTYTCTWPGRADRVHACEKCYCVGPSRLP